MVAMIMGWTKVMMRMDLSLTKKRGLREAAAAMVVGVGSMYDPPEAQGMAHFLEHMLFMGTKKYPTENAFDAFLSKQGGSDNAYTELEYTVYHFEIPQEGLFQALDMFAQFFIHPLLLEDAVERELNSIESEFQLSKNSDHCRVHQIMCHTCGHDVNQHAFAKFSWGNLKSLKDIPEQNNVCIMELLRTFYNQVRRNSSAECDMAWFRNHTLLTTCLAVLLCQKYAIGRYGCLFFGYVATPCRQVLLRSACVAEGTITVATKSWRRTIMDGTI